jgi:hypothetical protein
MQKKPIKALPLVSINNKRICGECTACCDGWLTANIKGEDMYPGKPCQFSMFGKGCSDYKNRPEDPCVTFKCEWLSHPEAYPDQLRPDRSKAIFVMQDIKDIQYLKVVEAGQNLQADILTFAMKTALSNGFNFAWQVNGTTHWYGSTEFSQAMAEEHG